MSRRSSCAARISQTRRAFSSTWVTDGTGCELHVAALEHVERVVRDVGADNIAAHVSEPIHGSGGVNPPALGYLQGMQRLCRENDILLIADGVITGFGRTGHMFASQRY